MAHGSPPDDNVDRIIEDQAVFDAAGPERVPFRPYDIVVLAIFVALFAIVFLQFFTRYVLNDSISWTEEAARYLLICLAFVGAVKCQLIGSHIRLDFIDQWVGKTGTWLLAGFALAAMTGFGVFATYSVWQLIARTSFQRMVSLPFPKYYLYAVVIAAIAIFTGVCLVQFIQLVRRGRA